MAKLFSSRKDARAMGELLSGGSSARGSVYSRTMREPEKKRAISSRALAAMFLLVALPPIGIGFIWRKRMFMPRGRIVLTVISTFIMTLMLIPLLSRGGLQTVLPVPSAPVALTYGGTSDFQANYALIPDATPAQTAVYVSSEDQYYHVAAACEDKTLDRSVTVAEALADGKTACPVCNPPSA